MAGPKFCKQVEREGAGPDVGLTLTIRKNSTEFQTFSSKMQSHYARMKVVDDRWRKSQSMEFVTLALSRFKLDFEDEQKKFVEAVSDPEGVDKVYTVMKKAPIKCQDIPDKVKKSKLVIISGAPGVGKSTLVKKLCQDISKQINDHKYDLVLLVELRDLIAFKDLQEPFELHHLLQLFCSTKGDAADLAQEMIAKGGRDVLLILDGYDELLHELRESPFFLNLLMHSPRSPLPECNVVLTSRSIATSQIYKHFETSGTACNFINIEVLGFTTAQIKLYAKQYFTDEEKPELADSFTERIAMLPQIKSLCAIPIVLSIICRVYLKDEQLPSTLSSVYERFVIDKLLINSDSKGRCGSLQSLLDLPQDHTFYHLCELAFQYVKEQKVIFLLDDYQADGKPTFTNRGHGYGLLTARPINEFGFAVIAVDSFYFIHLTVQEYLSALHIARQDIALQKEIWAEYLGQPHMAQVWRFFCGITGLASFDALHLTSKVKDKDFLVQSLYESQNGAMTGVAMQAAFRDRATVKPRSPYSAIAYGYCLQHCKNMKKLVIDCARTVHVHLGNLLSPMLQTASNLHLSLKNCHPTDLQEANDSLKGLAEEQNPTHDSTTGHPVPRSVDKVTLSLTTFPLDVLCDVVPFCEHVNELKCEDLKDPKQSLSLDLLSKMTSSLAQNNIMVKLVLHCENLAQKEDVKLFTHHLLVGLSTNTTLTDLSLSLPRQCWVWLLKANLEPRHVKRLTLDRVPLDLVCDVVKYFEHVEELNCVDVQSPQQSLSLDLLNKMSTSLAQNKTMVKLTIRGYGSDLSQVQDGKLFIRYLLLALSGNNTLTDLTLSLPRSCWDWPEGNLVQRSVENVSLNYISLDFVCEALEFFGHVKELECTNIMEPQQSGVTEDDLKLEEFEGTLAGHESLKKLRFDFAGGVPQTLIQRFGVAAVRGVARNRGIAEFCLEPWVCDQNVVDDILAQLTPDERRKFRVGKDRDYRSSIELCPVGGPSSGGAPPSTDSQPTSEDTVMDLDRTEDSSVVRETSCPFPTEPAVGAQGDEEAVDQITQGGSLSSALQHVPLDSLCERLCNLAQAEELNCDSITDPQQSLNLDLLNKMATLLSQNTTLKRLELGSHSLTQYKEAKLFTQHLMLGAAGSSTLTEVCIGFSSWWRDCHIQSGHVAGIVQKVTMCGAPLDVLCDLLPVFAPVEQLVCLDIKDPQESNMTMKLMIEVERALTGSTQLKKILFDCCWLQSTPELFFSLCISSLLKGAARNKSITSVQLTHNEEHIQQVEEVLTYLLTDLSAEERKRIGRSQCALESGLVCSCIEVLPISGSLSSALRCVPLDSLCERLCNLAQAEELNCDSITDPQQSLSLDLLNKMATSLAQNTTLKRLELKSDSLTKYKDVKLFTQHLMLGAAGSSTLTEVCIGFSSWWRDCHIQSGHVTGGVQKVTMCGAPLDVLCDMLPVFEPVEQLVCLDIKDPQESNMTMAALKLSEVEQTLTGSTQMKRILFDCCSLQSTPEWFFSLCISSLLKGAARSKSITNVQVTHSEEHHPQVEEVLTCLLTDLSVEERMRIEKGQCTLESGLVCPCVEVLPISSRKGKRSATEGAPFLPKKGRACSD